MGSLSWCKTGILRSITPFRLKSGHPLYLVVCWPCNDTVDCNLICTHHSNCFACGGHPQFKVRVIKVFPSGCLYGLFDCVKHTAPQEEWRFANSFAAVHRKGVFYVFQQRNIEFFWDIVEGRDLVGSGPRGEYLPRGLDPSVVVIWNMERASIM